MNLLKKRLIFGLFIFLQIAIHSNSASVSCKLISPIQYKVSSGTSNFIFTLQMQGTFISDGLTHPCEYGIMIQQLLCVQYVTTECCCNSFNKVAKAVCRINQTITQKLQYYYAGIADIQNANTATTCTGMISIVIDDSQPGSNLGLIIGIIGGVIILTILISFFVYKKVVKPKKSPKQDQDKKRLLFQQNEKGKIINKNVSQKQKIILHKQVQKDRQNWRSERDKKILNQILSKDEKKSQPKCYEPKKPQIKKYEDQWIQKPNKQKEVGYYKSLNQKVKVKSYKDDEDFKKWKYQQYLKQKQQNKKWGYNKNEQKLKLYMTPSALKKDTYKINSYQIFNKSQQTYGTERDNHLSQEQRVKFIIQQQKQYEIYKQKRQTQKLKKDQQIKKIKEPQYQQHVTISFPVDFHNNVTPSNLKKDQQKQADSQRMCDQELARIYRESLIRIKH